LRICLLCYRGNPYSGGQGIYLKYIAEELVRQGHEVHAIVGPPYPLEMKGVKEHRLNNNEYFIKKKFSVINKSDPFDIFNPINLYEYLSTRLNSFSEINAFSIRAYLKLRDLSKSIKFDVIHDNQCVGYGLLLMKSLGIPVITTIHHPLSIDLENVIERASSFFNKMKSVMFYPLVMQVIVSKRLDHVITVSEDSKKKINQYFGVPMGMQTVVYNGLDRSIFRPMKDVRKVRGKIIFVGNVEDGKKGFAYLVKALGMVKSGVRLTVVDGGSPHHRVTSRLIENLGLGGRIEFTGKINTDELVRQYAESELAIVPSTYEGFGFPAAEAMSCGVPVLASDGGALPEVVGDAGVVVPARNVEALAEAIDRMSDRQALEKMSGMGIRRVSECFTWEGAVTKMVDVYRKYAV
jgi:glycosyltransferase involved in cell wall biosynthesis